MTSNQRRNDGKTEPSWCTGEHTNGGSLPLHKSPIARVGPQPVHRGRGQAAVWLTSGGNGPTWVAVQAAHMTSVTAELSLDDAEQFHVLLGQIIARAKAG